MNLTKSFTLQVDERSFYPTRYRDISPISVFTSAALELDNYKRNKARGNIDLAADLILDASGYFHKNKNAYEFILVYKDIFPEIDIEKIRKIDKLSPMFAKKTFDLGQKLANPERLDEEERANLIEKLCSLSNSIRYMQHY